MRVLMPPASVRIPMHFPTDEEGLAAAVRMSGQTAAAARLVQVRNTLALDRLVVSEHYASEIAARSDLTRLERLTSWDFNGLG